MENNNNSVQKPCGYCSATGKAHSGDFGDEIITCPICQGSTKVIVPADSVLHDMCDGKGIIRIGRGAMAKMELTCPDCHGKGWMSPSHPAKNP